MFYGKKEVDNWRFNSLGTGVRAAKIKFFCKEYLTSILHSEASNAEIVFNSLNIRDLDDRTIILNRKALNNDEICSEPWYTVCKRMSIAVDDLKRVVMYDVDNNSKDAESSESGCFVNDVAAVLLYGNETEKRLANALHFAYELDMKLSSNMLKMIKDKASELLKMVKAYKIKDELNFTLLGTQFWYVNDIMINGMDSGDIDDKQLELLKALNELDYKLFGKFGSSLKSMYKTIDSGCIILKYVGNDGKSRIATKSEVKRNAANLFDKKVYILDVAEYYRMYQLMLLANGKESTIKRLSAILKDVQTSKDNTNRVKALRIEQDDSATDVINRNISEIKESIEYISRNFDSIIKSIELANSGMVYPDRIEDSGNIAAMDITVEEMVKTVLDGGITTKYDELPYKIARECRRKNRYSLSEKQMEVVRRRYDYIIKNGSGKEYKEKCLGIANELREKYWRICDSKVKDIIKYTIDNRGCSSRQLEVLERQLMYLKDNKNDENRVNEYYQPSLFTGSNDIEQNIEESYTPDKYNSISVSGISNVVDEEDDAFEDCVNNDGINMDLGKMLANIWDSSKEV